MKTVARLLLSAVLLTPAAAGATLTLDSCLSMARYNYPLVRQYDLVANSAVISLSDINKGWLPQIGIYAQGTVQNAVPQFPEALRGMMQQMGGDLKGLGKLQYKVGVDVSQTIWDGGASKAAREQTRMQEEAGHARLDVEMYGINERVQNLYFGILLLDRQMEQTALTLGQLASNINEMEARLRNGLAMQSDVDMLRAQSLTLGQQLASARGSRMEYMRMLGLFVGRDVTDEALEVPEAEMPGVLESARPELAAFDARLRLNATRSAALNSSMMPKIGLFVQAYEGYPGFDYFKSMRTRDLSFNVMGGVRISWSISPFYTRANNRRSIELERQGIENDREVFMFNNRIRVAGDMEQIESMRKVMADDPRIVELRANVRRTAEAQLRNGVIDADALLSKITDEAQARLAEAYHEIRLIQLIYQLKNTLNK